MADTMHGVCHDGINHTSFNTFFEYFIVAVALMAKKRCRGSAITAQRAVPREKRLIIGTHPFLGNIERSLANATRSTSSLAKDEKRG